MGAERAGEHGRAHRLSRSDPWPPGPSPWPMGLRGYHLIRSSMRFVPHKGPRGGPPLLPGAPAPRWARRRPLGPWRTSPSPTPGPLPPDGGGVGEGPGRFTPFLGFPPTGRRVVSPPLAREVPPPPTLLSPRATNCARATKNRGHYSPPTRPQLNYCGQQTRNSDERAQERDKDQGKPASERTAPPRLIQGQLTTNCKTSPRPTRHRLPRPDPPTSNPHTQKK